MKYLFRSCAGESLALALRVVEEGNEARLAIHESNYRSVGDGLIEKTKDFPGSVGWADIIVYDGTAHGLPDEAERLRRSGKAVVGGSAFADKLEHDRDFAIKLAETLGIETPLHRNFDGPRAFDRARQFLSGQPEESGWAWKPNGQPPEIYTTVAHSREEMLRDFDRLENLYEQLKGAEKQRPDFILEKKVEGIEVSTEGWWSGREFSLFNSTLERKWLFDGDLGEQTGCMGNVVWLWSEEARLPKMLFGKLGAILGDKYRGPIDINAIVRREDGKPVFLEFTPRFGYSAIFAFSRLVPDLSRLLAETALGRPCGEGAQNQMACGVRATIPPYPYDVKHIAEGRPVFGFDPDDFNPDVHPCEIRVGERGDIETAGPEGIVFEVTGVGANIEEAREACYAELEALYVPDIRYRQDIGKQAKRDYAALADVGLVTSKTREELFG